MAATSFWKHVEQSWWTFTHVMGRQGNMYEVAFLFIIKPYLVKDFSFNALNVGCTLLSESLCAAAYKTKKQSILISYAFIL